MAKKDVAAATPPAFETDETASSFKLWRNTVGLSQRQAMSALQKGRTTIQSYERNDKKTGKPVTPSFTTRIAMAVLARDGEFPEPWPE